MALLNARFENFWAQHGEMLVWKLWAQKYPDQVQYQEVATMPAAQEVEVGGEGEGECAEDIATQDNGRGEEEGENSGWDGNGKDVPVAETSAQEKLAASQQRMDANGDAHFDSPSLNQNASGFGGMLDASGDASFDSPSLNQNASGIGGEVGVSGDASLDSPSLNQDASGFRRAVDANGDASSGTSGPHQDTIRAVPAAPHPSGDTPQSRATLKHLGGANETGDNISTESRSQPVGNLSTCVDETSAEGDVEEDGSTQPSPGEGSQSETATTVTAVVGEESDQGSIPTTHLIGLNQAIQSTLGKFREDSTCGETQDEGGDGRTDGSTGSGVAGEVMDRVHMMHCYASGNGGTSGQHQPDQNEGADGTGGDSDGNPVSRICVISFTVHLLRMAMYNY